MHLLYIFQLSRFGNTSRRDRPERNGYFHCPGLENDRHIYKNPVLLPDDLTGTTNKNYQEPMVQAPVLNVH